MNKTQGRSNVLGAVFAIAAALAGSPAFSLAQAPADAPAVAKIPATSPPTVTPERIYTAMMEAERHRAQAMRPDPSVPKSVAEQWGIEVIRVDNTAGGFWLGFRFRVTDAKKALPLFDSRVKPYLESERSGARFAVPSAAKVGALRTTNRGHNIKPGKIYNIMFANPGTHVKPGQKVSIVIGDFKVEHLTVK